jgi:hypothetical protein
MASLRAVSALLADQPATRIAWTVLPKVERALSAFHRNAGLYPSPTTAVCKQGLPVAISLPPLKNTRPGQPETGKGGCTLGAGRGDLSQNIQ